MTKLKAVLAALSIGAVILLGAVPAHAWPGCSYYYDGCYYGPSWGSRWYDSGWYGGMYWGGGWYQGPGSDPSGCSSPWNNCPGNPPVTKCGFC